MAIEVIDPGDRAVNLILNSGKRLVPCQQEMLTAKPSAWIRACVGGYASGKTMAGVLGVLAHAIRNPWNPRYNQSNPRTLIIGTTWAVLKDSAYALWEEIVPPELIREHRKGDRITVLENGHQILWRTTRGKIEGGSVSGLYLDEAHLLDAGSGSQWLNYQARVRDTKCYHRSIHVTGLPVYGWCQEAFSDEKSASDPARLTIHAKTSDNPYLPPDYLTQLRASVSRQEAQAYFDGAWMPMQGAALYEYSPSDHLTDDRGNRNQACHVALDVGRRGAVVWLQERDRMCRDQKGQPYKATGYHVVDEILPSNLTVRQVAREIASRGWVIDPNRSRIYVDPNTDGDEMQSLREQFGNRITIVRKTRKDSAYYIEYGLRCLNAALRDADGNIRLTINSHLPRHERGLHASMPAYRVEGQRWQAVKDNRTDHVIDALRIAIADLLPLKDGSVRVIERAR